MKIGVDPNNGVLIHFQPTEMRVALSLLNALYTVTNADFIKNAIDEIEDCMKPKLLPFTNYQHLCHKCFMMVDEKSDNALKMTKDGDVTWRHKLCQDLKKNRPN